MLTKLQSLFPNALLFQHKPDHLLSMDYYLFFDDNKRDWLAIPKKDIGEKELNILNALYEQDGRFSFRRELNSLSPRARIWYDFLFEKGQPPVEVPESYTRFIQFHLNGKGIEKQEIETALTGFFSEDITVIWESEQDGIVIENHNYQISSLSEKELLAMTKMLESDFFIQISFYYGKQYVFTNQLAEFFLEEKDYFSFARNSLEQEKVFTFERVFPSYMAFHLPADIKEKVTKSVAGVFQEDPDMFSTIKVFLENNLNASLTAKKLYIHRNTLQYRIDKFTDKTGIQLKDFYGAFTIFLACLISEANKENSPIGEP